MNLAITRIKQIIPHFNEKSLNESDFWRIVRYEKITVVETDLFINGFYFECSKGAFIYLNSNLRGVIWLENAFHELAHYFLHTPPGSQRQEEEASAIALMALLPISELEKAASEADDFSEVAGRILHERLRIFAAHGL